MPAAAVEVLLRVAFREAPGKQQHDGGQPDPPAATAQLWGERLKPAAPPGRAAQAEQKRVLREQRELDMKVLLAIREDEMGKEGERRDRHRDLDDLPPSQRLRRGQLTSRP